MSRVFLCIISGISSVTDLSRQNKISYGVIESSAEYEFFAKQKAEPYQDMYTYMQNENTFVTSVEHGVNKVRNSYG